jgi:hypothetical protein
MLKLTIASLGPQLLSLAESVLVDYDYDYELR